MTHVILYAKNQDSLPDLKRNVEGKCNDPDYNYIFFEYPMDILDYLNTARPSNCSVFFSTDDLDNALEISSRITDMNPKYRFVLICNTYGDIEELFHNGVSYYLNSPYTKESMDRCVVNMKKYHNDQKGQILTLKTKKGTEALNVPDIRYVMSDKRKVVFYMDDEREASYYYKLDEVAELLGESFLRCHQSFIVNMKRIKLFVEDGLLLENDDFVPVSRKKYYSSKREYLSYITGNRIEQG